MEVQISYLSLGNQPNHGIETWVDQTAYSDELPKRKISEPSLLLLFNNPLHTTIFTCHITHVLRF